MLAYTLAKFGTILPYIVTYIRPDLLQVRVLGYSARGEKRAFAKRLPRPVKRGKNAAAVAAAAAAH